MSEFRSGPTRITDFHVVVFEWLADQVDGSAMTALPPFVLDPDDPLRELTLDHLQEVIRHRDGFNILSQLITRQVRYLHRRFRPCHVQEH